MDPRLESEVNKVAEVFQTDESRDAAAALSQALMPMNTEDYKDFLSAVAAKAPGESNLWSVLDLSGKDVHIWSKKDLSPDYVLVMPGQTLSQIARNEDYQPQSPERTKEAVQKWAEWNDIEDPNKLRAGQVLGIPQNL